MGQSFGEKAKKVESERDNLLFRRAFKDRETRIVVMEKEKNNEKYLKEIERLIKDEYYGKIIISLEKGRIVYLKKEQTIKL